ncbi:MAG: SDR family oxidoreductase [Rhodoferax sp.]|nr:SDR family oxidoreductase [Rhodoferax sp.]
MGAAAARFRRERVLIVGCGDVGLRVVQRLPPGLCVLALTSNADKLPGLRAMGVKPLLGNLDDRRSLLRLPALGTRLIHLAPPPATGAGDPRTRALSQILLQQHALQSFVYGSTSGVYGDCLGEIASENKAVNPSTERARRRIDAEIAVRRLGRLKGVATSILRIPGIYAPDRVGGTPRERLLRGTPVLRVEDDVYTNHIHADDLARACIRAMWVAKPGRVYNINDDTCLKMGDYFDLAADLYGLPRPPRVSRDVAQQTLPKMQLSFMGESRRMDNRRMKTELGLSLCYPTVTEGLLS